ncbi:hypothetical protein DM02DRAFT_628343 [Periconia macrospinosa]|uniref:Rhodopsin domain-containing protein n=1 Tax=Periconia macrospinosa TaxID=97972 RepID=A0A2V1DQR6_9PLEO|nr:hypothetical protein DM02DRAFT_628343 [Periconia macrospinosa]
MAPPPTAEEIAYMEKNIGDDRTGLVFGVHSVFMVIGVVSVVLRFLSRFKVGAKLGKDDWLILAALASLIIHAGSCMITPKFGVGRHVILVSNVEGIIKVDIPYLSNAWVDTRALGLRCVCDGIGDRTTFGLYFPLVIVIFKKQSKKLSNISGRVHFSWGESPNSMKCINFRSDWLLLLLPIPVVWSLQLGQRTKIIICSLFALGGAVCVISIVRVSKAHDLKGVDPTWNYVPVQALSTIEGSIGVLAACMPTWRPLFRSLGQGLSSYFSHKGSRHAMGSGYHRSGEHGFSTKRDPHISVSSAHTQASNQHVTDSFPHSENLAVPTNSSTNQGIRRSRQSKRNKSNTSDDSVERMLQGRVHGTGTGSPIDVEMKYLSEMGMERSDSDVGYSVNVEASAGAITKPKTAFSTS